MKGRRGVGATLVGATRLVVAAAAMLGSAQAGHENADAVVVESGPLEAVVRLDPFRLSFRQDGEEILADVPTRIDPTDPSGRHGPLGFAVDARSGVQTPAMGYGLFAEVPIRWFHATRVLREERGRWIVATDDPLGRTFSLAIEPVANGVIRVDAVLSDFIGVTATGGSFTRSSGGRFLGFGERSDGADQTGKVVETWAEEGPWSAGSLRPVTEPLLGERWQGPPPFSGTNFPMPWFVSSEGYGFLLDSVAYNVFRLDREGAWSVETRERRLAFLVFAGPTPAEVLSRFVGWHGPQPHPAPWFFGPWFQPSGPGDQLAIDFREQDVPVTVAQTFTHYLPCAAHWGRRDAQRARVRHWHQHGYKITTYVNSFVCETHPGGAYDEGDENGYFVKTLAGTTYPVPYAAFPESSSAVVDFTNPAAASWWQGLVREALEDGYDGWMEDFGEYVPPDAVLHDGRTGIEAHNEYCTTYHRTSDELTRPLRGDDFAQFVRCGYTGTAPFARVVWGGDPTEDDSKADGLAAAVSQGISMGLSGIAFWGSDIGGFHSIFTSGRTSENLLIRWFEFGALSGVMRTEANGYGRPDQGGRVQVWDASVLPVWRRYTKLRTQLYPYVWAAANEYRAKGIPIMRHLALAYPNDPKVYAPEAEYEFLFGPDLLVAPVTQEDATARTLYLPEGEWYEFWKTVKYDEASGEYRRLPAGVPISGGRLLTVAAPLEEIPIFVRADTCLPMLPPDVDTLADVGDWPGLRKLKDVVPEEIRTLAFGECPS